MATSYEKRRRIRTARHEVGHAGALLELGIPFKNVEILKENIDINTPNLGYVVAEDGQWIMGIVRMDEVKWMAGDCRMEPTDRIMQAMAGMAGEQIDWKKPNFNRADWKESGAHDMEDAKFVAKTVRDVTKKRVSIATEFDRAVTILRKNRNAHAALTKALLEKSILTYEECLAIWEANRG
jgi:hypothetical protein